VGLHEDKADVAEAYRNDVLYWNISNSEFHLFLYGVQHVLKRWNHQFVLPDFSIWVRYARRDSTKERILEFGEVLYHDNSVFQIHNEPFNF